MLSLNYGGVWLLFEQPKGAAAHGQREFLSIYEFERCAFAAFYALSEPEFAEF
jgi:hypothetical protein